MKQTILAWADRNQTDFIRLSQEIHAHPERSGEEHRAAALHASLLRKYGFQVQQPFLGLDTAFHAVYDSGRPGPCVAYLAEYDALPQLGHGCGHNLLGAVSTMAGIALSQVLSQTGGRVLVLGCPAEETDGAKVKMAAEGVFTQVDAAMLAHPYHRFQESGSSAALQAIRVSFFGREAHAADAPGTGINALDGVLALFRSVDLLRPSLPTGTTINGVIPHGGTVANVIPGYASADFHLRGRSSADLDALAGILEREAKGIAARLGARVEVGHYESTYQNMVTNQALSSVVTEYLHQLGVAEVTPPEDSPFSLDMGNVSQVCPAIHPYFGICQEKKAELHTAEFCACASGAYAHQQALVMVKALALTGWQVLTDQQLLNKVKEEFGRRSQGISSPPNQQDLS